MKKANLILSIILGTFIFSCSKTETPTTVTPAPGLDTTLNFTATINGTSFVASKITRDFATINGVYTYDYIGVDASGKKSLVFEIRKTDCKVGACDIFKSITMIKWTDNTKVSHFGINAAGQIRGHGKYEIIGFNPSGNKFTGTFSGTAVDFAKTDSVVITNGIFSGLTIN